MHEMCFGFSATVLVDIAAKHENLLCGFPFSFNPLGQSTH